MNANHAIPDVLSDTEVGLLRIAHTAAGGNPHRLLEQICTSGPPQSAVVELAKYWPGLSLEGRLIAVIQGMAFEPGDWLAYTSFLVVDDSEGETVQDRQLVDFYHRAGAAFTVCYELLRSLRENRDRTREHKAATDELAKWEEIIEDERMYSIFESEHNLGAAAKRHGRWEGKPLTRRDWPLALPQYAAAQEAVVTLRRLREVIADIGEIVTFWDQKIRPLLTSLAEISDRRHGRHGR